MSETVAGNVRREAGSIVWFEPAEPLGGVGRLAMTTRLGGLSQPPFGSLNLGYHVGDVGERVRLNREAVLRALGTRLKEPVVGEQVHGACARTVGALHAGTRWQQPEKALAATDALVTSTPRLPLVCLVADCLPVALVDPVRQVAAVAHAGWRGISAGVLESTLSAMQETWGVRPEDTVAWLGPAIGPCCYEVGGEVASLFPGHVVPASISPGKESGPRVDLRAAATARLRRWGLLEENVTGLAVCTSCRHDLFFSHRRAQREGLAVTGRQALFLWLDPAP